MRSTPEAHVTGRDGLHGTIEDCTSIGCGTQEVPLKLDDGRCVLVPGELLIKQADGSYYLALAPEDVERASRPDHPGEPVNVVPLIEERARIDRKRVQTGTVRVVTRTTEREEFISEPLVREEMDVQRVPVNQPVDHPPSIRHEGERIIVPVVEEVLVVEKRLVVREEIHLVPRRTTETYEQRVTLRRQEADVQKTNETSGS